MLGPELVPLPEVERQEILLKSGIPSDTILLPSDVKAIRSLLVQSEGNAPSTVISHRFSSLGEEVWRFMAPMSRFVLNDGVVKGSPDTSPFSRGVSFLTTDVATVASLYNRQTHKLGDLLHRTDEPFIVQDLKEHMDGEKLTLHDISSLNALAAFSHNEADVHKLLLLERSKFDLGKRLRVASCVFFSGISDAPSKI